MSKVLPGHIASSLTEAWGDSPHLSVGTLRLRGIKQPAQGHAGLTAALAPNHTVPFMGQCPE